MEKKKILIISGGVVIILILAIATFFVSQKRQASIISPIQPPGILKEKEAGKLLTYKDEAGFEFAYPENLTVKDVSGDLPVYSSLEISSSQHEGKMAIKITDTSFASLDAWLKSKGATGAGSTREITLSGMPGSQIQFTNPRRLVTIAIDEGIMYFIQSPLDEQDFWNKVHNEIVSSFTIGETRSPTDQGGEEVIYEEEEVIE